MPIVQQGSINTTALVVPDLYVQIVPPQNLVLNGVPTNVVGVVGTATWGPVGQPVIVATMADYAQELRTHHRTKVRYGHAGRNGSPAGCAELSLRPRHGQYRHCCAGRRSRHTVAFTALYTGTLGNRVDAVSGAGIQGRHLAPDRVPAGPAAGGIRQYRRRLAPLFWTALANAVNHGQGPQRGPSQLIVASAGGATIAPVGFSIALGSSTAGSDGADGANGSESSASTFRRGPECMPCVDRVVASRCCRTPTIPTHWTVQAGFGLEEGIYMILTGPAGDTIQNAVMVKRQAGLDGYAAKLMFGDWLWWSDQVNGTIRLVSPQGFAAGRLANLSPEQSSLNKPLYSVIGSQKSGTPGSGQRARTRQPISPCSWARVST